MVLSVMHTSRKSNLLRGAAHFENNRGLLHDAKKNLDDERHEVSIAGDQNPHATHTKDENRAGVNNLMTSLRQKRSSERQNLAAVAFRNDQSAPAPAPTNATASTQLPTPGPTRVPSANPTAQSHGAEWAIDKAGPMICVDNFPLQVHKESGNKYSIGALDSATGAYEALPGGSEMEWTDNLHINAVSQWTSPTDNHFAFASVEGELCRINVGGADCFSNGKLESEANAGAVVGDNYYYGKNAHLW